MNMHFLDWSILSLIVLVIIGIALFTTRYTRSVSDFLSASRCAGRYMLTMAEGMSALSAVAFVAFFERYYQAGFPAMWWNQMMGPLFIIISISGWVSYRFRETRAMTMAQFFEIRYSRPFRVFSGIICWVSGILNYGIFPGVTARFLINFCGLPGSFEVLGFHVSTLPVVMFIMLTIAVLLTIAGGQIALMVTDFFQGQFSTVAMLVIIGFLFWRFGWTDIVEALKTAPEGQSMLNPYKQSNIPDFNLGFFLMMMAVQFYIFMAWQGSQGYFSSAKNPHEAKMARILANWRGVTQGLTLAFIPIVAYAVFHSVKYAGDAQIIQQALDAIGDEQVRTQMRVPLMLVHFLPVGLTGLFAALIFAAAISTDDTYLHSWGSIFIQDVVLPFRKKTLSPKEHIKWLRVSVVGMAVFAFFFSMLFPLRDFIQMYWQITGSIFTGGAGSVIIFGLYWKRGTTAAAWTSMIAGCTLALTGIVVRQCWGVIPGLSSLAPEFPLNGMQLAFFNALICISLYVLVSLLTCRTPFNMDRLLHRGKYAVAGEHAGGQAAKRPPLIWRILGVGREFTRRDRIISALIVSQTVVWTLAIIIGTIINLSRDVSEDVWARWWFGVVIYMMVLAAVTVTWFTVGGIHNLIDLFKTLGRIRRDAMDDGTVDES